MWYPENLKPEHIFGLVMMTMVAMPLYPVLKPSKVLQWKFLGLLAIKLHYHDHHSSSRQRQMRHEDHLLKCHNCGHQTNIDPALMEPDAPMQYCPECDEPLTVAILKTQEPNVTQEALGAIPESSQPETQEEIAKEFLSRFLTYPPLDEHVQEQLSKFHLTRK